MKRVEERCRIPFGAAKQARLRDRHPNGVSQIQTDVQKGEAHEVFNGRSAGRDRKADTQDPEGRGKENIVIKTADHRRMLKWRKKDNE